MALIFWENMQVESGIKKTTEANGPQENVQGKKSMQASYRKFQ